MVTGGRLAKSALDRGRFFVEGEFMTLNQLKIGRQAIIKTVGGEGELRQHFLDMGLIPGAQVSLIKFAPMGDPMEVLIQGYELTLRMTDAAQITVSPIEQAQNENCSIHADCSSCAAECKKRGKDGNKNGAGVPSQRSSGGAAQPTEHPGLGEGGRYHAKGSGHPLPEGTKLTFALAGNQNCGKTTLFNRLTGSNQHVGNFPGVTVDKKSGAIRGRANTEITDLPGIYSMSPYSSEEIVTRKFILEQRPACIINIVDATNIARNLYLTMQLMGLGIPMALALNMMDEVHNNGGAIDINEMEATLGIPVVAISASKNEGIEELIEHAIHVAKFQEKPGRMDFCGADDYGGAVHRCIHGIMHLIADHAENAGIPERFAATKIAEGDKSMLDAMKLESNERDMIERIICQMEEERGLDRAAAIADMRFTFIKKLVSRTVTYPKESKERTRSEKIDKALTGKWTALPCFVAIMALVFFLTFNVIGAALQGLLEKGITALGSLIDKGLSAYGLNPVIHSLVIDGIFAGVGSVLSFLPIIVVLFFFLSLLEDTGYMARVAFVMDKLLRKIGLSGRSIVPLLVGFGCTVPAVMSSRTLPSERDRKMTILLTPFMSCSAKLPVYGFFASVFFPKYAALVMVGVYFLGIAISVLIALLFKGTIFKGEAAPFVMELPNYRLPGAKNVCQLLWDKAKDFLQRAFTVIFAATVVIWFLQTFDTRINMVAERSQSMLAKLSGFVAPIFSPLGFGDWREATALITGFLAKESVVSTLGVLFGAGASIAAVMPRPAAAAMLVFCLLYTPCIAAVASVRRELGAKWAVTMVAFQCAIAWLFALAARGLALALGI